MDPLDTYRATAQELDSIARRQGIDLEPYRVNFTFYKDGRYINVWRKNSFPGSGPADVKEGTLLYVMQGPISIVPSKMKHSASLFRGSWFERGFFENIEQALELLKAWLIDRREIDDLPSRSIRAYGI
jgi:hypothetical protein